MTKQNEQPNLMTHDEERALWIAFKEGSEDAFIRLYDSVYPLVTYFANKYYGKGVDRDDLISIGSEAVVECMHMHDPSKGRLFSYTWSRIRSHMTNAIRKQQAVSQPQNQYWKGNTVSSFGITEENTRFVESFMKSLRSPSDILISKEKREVFMRALMVLDEADAFIINRSYGIDCQPMSLEDIAKVLNLGTKTTVMNHRRTAFKKMAMVVEEIEQEEFDAVCPAVYNSNIRTKQK